MINDKLYKRKYVIVATISVIIFVYILRLLSLQIVDNIYAEKADSNALLRKKTYPSRGLIYDRNNTLLVHNRPAYNVTLIMREMRQGFDTLSFCKALEIDTVFFNQRIKEIKNRRKNRGYSQYTPQIFMTHLSPKDIATLQETIYRFSGVYLQNRDLRDYTYPHAAHVLGSVGEVSRKNIEDDSFYAIGDYAGRDGIEYVYEKSLRGEKGIEILLRDSRGRIKGQYENGAYNIESQAGNDLTITIDIELQILAEKLLEGKIGSVVAIEPSTGEILALVSNPTWNPALLVGRNRTKNYVDLSRDETKPLFNRATQAQYAPGSTFKIIQALICLQEGGITEDTKFSCIGRSSRPIRCTHNHGRIIDLQNAIEQSCNPYFWNAFKETLEKNGYGDKNHLFKEQYEKWRNSVISFGFGGIFSNTDIYKQASGYVPTANFYKRYYGETGWRSLTIRSLSIGQGEILATPLQMANSMAIVANGGFYITPHLNKNSVINLEKHIIDVDKKHFSIMKEGMWRVFESGSGRYSKIDSLAMCGKTGTVQNNLGEDHSLFVGFAPKENPSIAISVVVENAGFGSVWATPIASLMMEQYIFGEIKRKNLFDHISKSITNENVKKR